MENRNTGKYLPVSKEEVLESVRQRRAVTSGIEHAGEAVWGAVQTDTERTERNVTPGRQAAQHDYGADESVRGTSEGVGSDTGSGTRHNHDAGQAGRTATGSDSSVHQHVGGTGRATEASKPASRFKAKLRQEIDLLGGIVKRHKEAAPKKAETTKGKRLSDAEAAKLRPGLITTILWTSEHLDQFIIATTKGHDASIEIWSNLDHDEAAILADFMLERGKQSPVAADYVRKAVALMDRLKLLVIIAPRLYMTLMTYLTKGISIY